jgi:hypothetical protein
MYFSMPDRGAADKNTVGMNETSSPPNASAGRVGPLERSRSMPASARDRRPSQIRRTEVVHLRGTIIKPTQNKFKPDRLLENQIPAEKDWNGRVCDFSKINDGQCKKMKGVFIESFDRPYKESLKRELGDIKSKRNRERADANREEFSKPWPARFNFLTPGEKVLIRLQEVMDANQSRVRELLMFDIDQRGKLDQDELHMGLTSMGFDLSAEELSSMFQLVDTDGNGTLDDREIIAAMRAAVKRARSVLGGDSKSTGAPSGPATPRLTPRALTPR